MPPGAPPGVRYGGRAKGTPNKSVATIEAVIARMKRPPQEILASIAENDVECPVCRGAGGWEPKQTELDANQLAVKQIVSSTNPKAVPNHWQQCKDCKGTGREPIPAKLSSWCSAELMQYAFAKRKAIEITGADGGPIKTRHELVFVKPGFQKKPE